MPWDLRLGSAEKIRKGGKGFHIRRMVAFVLFGIILNLGEKIFCDKIKCPKWKKIILMNEKLCEKKTGLVSGLLDSCEASQIPAYYRNKLRIIGKMKQREGSD